MFGCGDTVKIVRWHRLFFSSLPLYILLCRIPLPTIMFAHTYTTPGNSKTTNTTSTSTSSSSSRVRRCRCRVVVMMTVVGDRSIQTFVLYIIYFGPPGPECAPGCRNPSGFHTSIESCIVRRLYYYDYTTLERATCNTQLYIPSPIVETKQHTETEFTHTNQFNLTLYSLYTFLFSLVCHVLSSL